MPLKLVPIAEPTPAEQVRKRIRRMDRPAFMVQCNRCGGREMIEVKTGVLLKDGKPSGGTRQLLCAACMLRGERVAVL